MTDKQWHQQILANTIDRLRETLEYKGWEYASDESPYQNFYGGASLKNESPERVLWGYLTKHIISLKDAIDGRQVDYTEKIKDIQAYLVLLEGLLHKRDNRASGYTSTHT